MNDLVLKPIGLFKGFETARFLLPRQPGLDENSGVIELLPHYNYEQALSDLNGFEKIWLIYWFHQNSGWKPKVLPPRGHEKRGVFATRSPHRPNPLGLSCVTLKAIEGRVLWIQDHDLLDNTPIFDIKPYLPYADAYPEAHAGWVADLESEKKYEIIESTRIVEQEEWLKNRFQLLVLDSVKKILTKQPHPLAHNRIQKCKDSDTFELAYKTWRVLYRIDEAAHKVHLESLESGYDSPTLLGLSPSRWDDVAIHQAFVEQEWQEEKYT